MELLKSLDEKVIAKIDVDAIETDIVQLDEIELKTKLIIHKILLDLGSPRSYITFELKDKLNLAPIASEILNLNTFGSSGYTITYTTTTTIYA